MVFVIFDVFLNHVFRHLVTNSSHKVAIFPELSSPQLPFHLRIVFEYLSGRYPFELMHNIGYRVFGGKPQKYMNMIFRKLHNFYLIIATNSYLLKTLLHKIPQVSSQYPFAVFRSPYYMISCIIDSMTCSSYSHADRVSYFNLNLKDNVSSPP